MTVISVKSIFKVSHIKYRYSSPLILSNLYYPGISNLDAILELYSIVLPPLHYDLARLLRYLIVRG